MNYGRLNGQTLKSVSVDIFNTVMSRVDRGWDPSGRIIPGNYYQISEKRNCTSLLLQTNANVWKKI